MTRRVLAAGLSAVALSAFAAPAAVAIGPCDLTPCPILRGDCVYVERAVVCLTD